MSKAECGMTFRFERGSLTLDEVTRRTADMWADLPWDRDVLAALKRDGLMLDGLNLGGGCPYRLTLDGADQIVVSLSSEASADAWLDLWRLHFMRGLRPRSIAA